ncbi:MAG TPA: hypothetical protein VK179_19540 [Bacteroidales bacterium]|nr:hypothetical protein [Bacteroidales bacterium]
MDFKATDIKGLDEFTKMVNEFLPNVQREIMNKGFKEASTPLIRQAQENIGSKRIKKSIGMKLSKRNVALVGARRYGGYEGHLAHLFEEGTEERGYFTKKRKNLFKTEKKWHKTGRMRALHFFQRAKDQTEQLVFEKMSDSMINALGRIVAKYNKKYG